MRRVLSPVNRCVLQVAKRFVDGNNLQEGMLNRVEAVIRAFDPLLTGCPMPTATPTRFRPNAGAVAADQIHMRTPAPPKLIAWSGRYSVGISRIDTQHQRLVDLINELHAAMLAGEGDSALAKILDGLAGYAVSHFATEETLMKKFGYPGYEQHKAEHDKLAAQVKLL